MNEKQYRVFENYQSHIRNLKRLFPKLRRLDDAEVLAKLRRLETWQSRNAVAYCNGEMQMDAYEYLTERTRRACIELLGPKVRPILILNGDPRGHALKLDEAWSKDKRIYRDWGSFGIIMPDF